MSAHTRTVFDADLQDLVRMVAEMGGLAEQQIVQAFDALAQRNTELARKVIERDTTLDIFQTTIAEKGINIIAQRQPLANDLREIVSALHISNAVSYTHLCADRFEEGIAAITTIGRIPVSYTHLFEVMRGRS